MNNYRNWEDLGRSIEDVVDRAVNMLSPVADAAGVAIRPELKQGCVIRCTADDLYQVCFNLVENAIKYNYTGGRIYVSVHKDADQILLEVADTGIGIPEEDIPKVFNRFYRVDKARSRAAGGTGLGLAIVSDTVRRRGGSVSAANRPEGGAVFTACWPVAEEAEV